MRITRITTPAELASLATDWNCLAAGVPFRRHEWLATWWKHYAPSEADRRRTTARELFVIAIHNASGHLVGVAPWFIERNLAAGRVVRFLGSGEVCSDYLSILATPEYAAPVAAALAEFLAGPAAEDWDAMELDGIDAEDDMIARLTKELVHHGGAIDVRPGVPCWRLALPASWDEYMAGVSKGHRKQLRRIETRLLDNGRATLHSVRDERGLNEAWPILVDLHQRRRQALGEPGCFASPRFASFHREAAAAMARAGLLRLDWLSIDGKPAAAEYHLAGGGIDFAYQAGVAPELMEDEPGRAITLALLRQAVAERFAAVDFLRGNEPYKAHFRATPRPSLIVRLAAPRATARWRHAAWIAGRRVKTFLKPSAAATYH